MDRSVKTFYCDELPVYGCRHTLRLTEDKCEIGSG